MSAPLSREEVAQVANLARLKLTEEELIAYTSQLGDVLGYIGMLNELDTEGIEPMAHAVEVTNVFRTDIPTGSLSRSEALANAPKTDGQFFLVPAILEES